MGRLKLHVPSIKEMEYRQQMLAQPETMSYNRGQGIDAPGYNNDTGCIDFPITDWRFWRDVWLWREPSRYSAYLHDVESDRFVGEACYFYDMEQDAHGVGVVIEAKYRGQGYGTEALQLLVEHAFAQEDVECLFVELPLEREAALRMYLTVGFRESKNSGQTCQLMLTREIYERDQKA